MKYMFIVIIASLITLGFYKTWKTLHQIDYYKARRFQYAKMADSLDVLRLKAEEENKRSQRDLDSALYFLISRNRVKEKADEYTILYYKYEDEKYRRRANRYIDSINYFVDKFKSWSASRTQ